VNSFEHNGEAMWLDEVKEDLRDKVEVMANIEVKMEDVVKIVRGMSNWKAPGPDGVQCYWFKEFVCLHKPIVNALQRCIVEGNVPEWIVTGRTGIQKDSAKGTETSNYRRERETREVKDQLFIDKAILKEVKRLKGYVVML